MGSEYQNGFEIKADHLNADLKELPRLLWGHMIAFQQDKPSLIFAS